ncbi:hypothetical protein FRB94_012934 [Tulasnella sp. JGI-2019a]|nr:hypothetical protein FRB94_012934 [Tulasnella sp. JGI-2019a]
MATAKKLVVVLGATGSQGKSIINELLHYHNETYAIRGLTRNATSAAAKEIVSWGASIFEGNLGDPSSLTGLFDGAYAIFAITDFWQKCDAEGELAQGRLVVDLASKVPTLEHFIWSSLPDAKGITGGVHDVLYYSTKTRIEEYIRSQDGLKRITTVLYVAYYDENWLKFPGVFGPTKTAEDKIVLSLPITEATSIASFDTKDIGLVVAGILSGKEKFYGKSIWATTGENVSEYEKIGIVSEIIGKPIAYAPCTAAEYKERISPYMPGHAIDAIIEMFALYTDPNFSYSDFKIIPPDFIPEGRKLTGFKEWATSADWSPLL